MVDLAVVGSGFGGSLLAMIARRLGLSVLLIEKGKHPRFAIGESSTPLSNLLLEEIAARYDLPRIAPLSKWGTVRRTYPHLTCGLKRGFTFYPTGRNERELLVAASPNDSIADTHWLRADFDAFFVEEAIREGVEYWDEVNLIEASQAAGGMTLRGSRRGVPVSFHAGFVVDATGPRGFLHHALGLTEAQLPGFPPTQGLFSHFSGVERPAAAVGTPYPPEDAAVHHVFDGGWIWVLRFANGITSAGVAATDEFAQKIRLSEGAAAWERLVNELPRIRECFAGAKAERPFQWSPRLSFRSSEIAGDRWALLPSAAGFVDPLLSTGFPLTLLGVLRLANVLDKGSGLAKYAAATEGELLATSHLIAALYANMHDFPVFASLTMLYFAAASYSETVRRLGRPELAGSFLLSEHPSFGPALRSICERALKTGAGLNDEIRQTIEPFNVGRFADPARKNWYPVEAADLLAAAEKLKAAPEEIRTLLLRSGF